jgi:aminopeptidase N
MGMSKIFSYMINSIAEYLFKIKLFIPKFYFLVLFTFLTTVFSFSQNKNDPQWYSDYDVKWYKIDIHANDTMAYIWGSTSILAKVSNMFSDTFHFELAGHVKIDSIKMEGKLLNYTRSNDIVSVPLLHKVNSDSLLYIIVYHRGGNTNSIFFSSFSSKKDTEWNIPVTWTLSEPFGAKAWFPCKQSLTDKADSALVCITVPKNLKAGSNGKLEAIIPVDTGNLCYRWRTHYPVAYYLISFAVADYSEYNFYAPVGVSDSVLVQNYIYNKPGFFEKNKSNIDVTADFIKLFSKLYGDYPFKKEKYGHCVAPMGGGMEHQTMTTLSGFGYDLISHELAHQWFGDLVTCSNWQDIWLNEGFASYSEYLAIENLKTSKQALEWMKNAFNFTFYYREGSVYIPSNESNDENRIFNYCLTYKKGASIIHTLRNEIDNDTLFFGVLKEYLSSFAYRTANLNDFVKILNQRTGRNYDWFFQQWYYGKGFPQMELFWSYKNDTINLLATQTHSAKGDKPFHLNYEIKLASSGRDTTLCILQDKWKQVYSFPWSHKVDFVEVNPEYKVLMKIIGTQEVADLPTMDSVFSVEKPNFSDELKIQINKPVEKKSLLYIADLKGNSILERKLKNLKTVVFDTKEFANGYFLLYLISGNNKFVRIINKI